MKPPSVAPRTWQSGLFLDPASREASRIFYRAIYAASEGVPSGFTGNVDAGAAVADPAAAAERAAVSPARSVSDAR